MFGVDWLVWFYVVTTTEVIFSKKTVMFPVLLTVIISDGIAAVVLEKPLEFYSFFGLKVVIFSIVWFKETFWEVMFVETDEFWEPFVSFLTNYD